MSYAALSDLNAQFGAAEVIQLTDRAFTGVADAAVATVALQKASTEVDSYISSRYPLPLAVVPDRLVEITCDIARYRLSGSGVTETDIVRLRYKDAIKDLEKIRDGKIDIGLSSAGIAPAENAAVQVVGGVRLFDSNTLRDY